MIAVVYNGTSKPSALRLTEAIKDTNKYDVRSVFYGSNRLRDKSITHVINVGNSNVLTCSKSVIIINNPSIISSSANKRLARIRFKVKKVPSPMLWLDYKEIPTCEFPVVGRTTHHMKGHGFWLCNTASEARRASIEGATHFIKFIKNTREFRLHTFSTKLNPKTESDYGIAKLAEKIESSKTRDRTVKNHDNGFVFLGPRTISLVEKKAIEDASKKALSVFGLNYGATDIMLSKDSGKPYVLEINTTPCLTDANSNTAEVYASMLIQMISNDR
jgi:carbamoylphosphate synthase large subunit